MGQQAHFTVDTYGDHEFLRTVTFIPPKAEIRANVVDYMVLVRMDGRNYKDRPQESATWHTSRPGDSI